MAGDWESIFAGWTKPASDAEETRYENTCKEIRKAIDASSALSKYHFSVYPKGSYPNFTNVVRDSDVDISVELTSFVYNEFTYEAEGLTLEDLGSSPASDPYGLPEFKDDVERALTAHFGSDAVARGDKAIRVRQTASFLKADVVPCATQRVWQSRTIFHDGIRLQRDSAPYPPIINYPTQHRDEGVAKNERCQKRYKRVVRILKNLENHMVKEGVISVVPSFLIESGVWNVPDHLLRDPATWTERVSFAVGHMMIGTSDDDCIGSDDWLEANGIKFLFSARQKWTRQDLNAFAHAAWSYCGL